MSEWQTAPAIQMKLDSWRGYSAYEIAVKNGFEGSEAEWLESLRGEKGEASDELTVNNKAAVDGNITLRGTDIYVQAGMATTITQALEKTVSVDSIVDALDSEEADKVLSAAQGKVLCDQVGRKAEIRTQIAALPMDAWIKNEETYEQTVSIAGVTADESRTAVIVSPPADRTLEAEYAGCGVRADAQGDDALVFTCMDLPGCDLEANVMVVSMGVKT